MFDAQPCRQPALGLRFRRQLFRRIVEQRKTVAAGGQEAARFGHRIGNFLRRILPNSAVGERQMLLPVAGVEPQQCFGNAGIIDRDIPGGEGWQVQIGEHRVFQHRMQPRGLLRAAIARHLRHIQLVGPRESQQHIGRQRSLVALQQRDIRGGNIEISGHIRLGQAKVAAQPPQSRPHINRAILAHCSDSCADFTTLQHKFVKIDN